LKLHVEVPEPKQLPHETQSMNPDTTENAADKLTIRRGVAAVLATHPGLMSPRLPANLPARRTPAGEPPVWPETPPGDYVRPAYSERFRCIASNCEDNCCKGWSVPIDQATYEKYRYTPGLKQHVGTLVVLNTNAPTPANYARIPLTAQAECGFLDGEKLCGIQKEHGHDMLSETCATYPRAISMNAGQVEKALNLSCPEAARVTLLDANLLGDGPWSAYGAERYAGVTRRRSIPPATALQVRDNAWRLGQRLGKFDPRLAVREFAVLLLGDRRYPMWQRLYLLGNLARRLQAARKGSSKTSVAAWCEAHPGAVAKLLTESARSVETESLRTSMDEIAMQPDQQIQLLVEMLRVRFSEPPVPMRFLECVRDFQLGLATATARTEQEILDAYSDGYRRYYRPMMDQHPHLLENYLINFVFKYNYPFGREPRPGRTVVPVANLESEHLSLCMHAALTQTLLIGMAAHYKQAFDTTHVVKLVQSLAKTLEHSRRSVEQISEFVQAKDLNNPKGIALLLRQQD